MNDLLTLPVGTLLVIFALLWRPKPKRKDDDFADLDDAGKPRPLTPQETRRYLSMIGLRLLIGLVGVLGVVIDVVSGFGSLDDMGIMVFFAGVYGGSLLILQRATRPALVFIVFAPVSFLVWRTAIYRAVEAEHDWGLVVALVINALVWWLWGRHHPPHDKIEVITS